MIKSLFDYDEDSGEKETQSPLQDWQQQPHLVENNFKTETEDQIKRQIDELNLADSGVAAVTAPIETAEPEIASDIEPEFVESRRSEPEFETELLNQSSIKTPIADENILEIPTLPDEEKPQLLPEAEIPPTVESAQPMTPAASASPEPATEMSSALPAQADFPTLFQTGGNQTTQQPEKLTTAETLRQSGLAWSAAIGLFGSVLFMLILGWFFDLLTGASPIGVIAGIFIGGAIGFYQFFRTTSQIFKKDDR